MNKNAIFAAAALVVGALVGGFVGASFAGPSDDRAALERCRKEADNLRIKLAGAKFDTPPQVPPARAASTPAQPVQPLTRPASPPPTLQATPQPTNPQQAAPATTPTLEQPRPLFAQKPLPPYFKPLDKGDPKLVLGDGILLDDANAALKRLLPEVDACFKGLNARTRQPNGRLVISFLLDTQGEEVEGKASLGGLTITENPWPDETFTACVTGAMSTAFVFLPNRNARGKVQLPIDVQAQN